VVSLFFVYFSLIRNFRSCNNWRIIKKNEGKGWRSWEEIHRST